MATHESRLSSLITAIGADIKTLSITKTLYVPFGRTGNLAIFTGPRVYFPDNVDFKSASFAVTTAPTGASALFDITRNGSTSVLVSNPTIVASGFVAASVASSGTTTLTAQTDYLQVKCLQIGSTIAGADLTVVLKLVLT